MNDKNGIRINAGDIVRIEGAFFKNDNGLYFVEQDGTNPGYLADDREVTLKKICRNGKISTGKYNICFFPIKAFVNDKMKCAEAIRWNKAHATIEIVYNIDNSAVIDFFEEEARKRREQAEWYKMRGYAAGTWESYEKTAGYYEAAAVRMKNPEPIDIDEFIRRYAPAN